MHLQSLIFMLILELSNQVMISIFCCF